MNEALTYFLMSWTDLKLLSLVAAGSFAGIYIGAIPGLSVTMAVSILISFTFSWDILSALALMAGIYMGGVYGGSRTAILLNIPGTVASVATALDGYPLAKRGEAGEAIGLSTVMSFLGGLLGVGVLAIAAPIISEFTILFQPRDYLMLGIMGLLLVGALSGESLSKGIFSGALGLFIGMIGLDSITAQERFTFGQELLWGGISPIAVMIGLFGISEVIYQLHHLNAPIVKQKLERIIPRWSDVRKYFGLSMQSSAIGVVVGALPGAGGDIAALLAYDNARRVTRNPEVPFGKGAKEGLVASESANNAAVGGAYIPMLTLGIPGDAVTAVMLGALYIHGLNPGPLLLVERPEMFWFTVGTLVLACVFMLIGGLTGVRVFSKIVEVPKGILLPLITLLSVVGAFGINNSVTDVWFMLGFGALGYFMRQYGFPLGPAILGVILFRIIDDNWRRAIISTRESLPDFFLGIVTSPLSLGLFLFIVLVILGQTPLWRKVFGKKLPEQVT
jgi:putative tricarboxylic transport membrane protein